MLLGNVRRLQLSVSIHVGPLFRDVYKKLRKKDQINFTDSKERP